MDSSSEALVVIASDGLWDVTSAERVAELAVKIHRTQGATVCSVAETILRHAQDCKSKDDVTVMVLAVQVAPNARAKSL